MASDTAVEVHSRNHQESNIRYESWRGRNGGLRKVSQPKAGARIIISLIAGDIRAQHNENHVAHKVVRTRFNFNNNPATNKRVNIRDSPTPRSSVRDVQERKPLKAEGLRLEHSASRIQNIHVEREEQLQLFQNCYDKLGRV